MHALLEILIFSSQLWYSSLIIWTCYRSATHDDSQQTMTWSACFLSCLSSKCKFLVTEDMQSCANLVCPGRDQPFSASTGFDLLVDLTDHTGTLHACALRSPVAEKTLGRTVSTTSKKEDYSASILHVVQVCDKQHFHFTCCRQMSLPVWLMTSGLQWSGNSFWRDAKYMWRYCSFWFYAMYVC